MSRSKQRKYLDHSKHQHPVSSYWRDRCRAVYNKTGQPVVATPEEIEKHPGDGPREPLQEFVERGMTASQVAQQIVDEAHQKRERKNAQRRRLTLSEIRSLGESLDMVEGELNQYATVESIEIVLRTEGHKVLAVWSENDWTFETL